MEKEAVTSRSRTGSLPAQDQRLQEQTLGYKYFSPGHIPPWYPRLVSGLNSSSDAS